MNGLDRVARRPLRRIGATLFRLLLAHKASLQGRILWLTVGEGEGPCVTVDQLRVHAHFSVLAARDHPSLEPIGRSLTAALAPTPALLEQIDQYRRGVDSGEVPPVITRNAYATGDYEQPVDAGADRASISLAPRLGRLLYELVHELRPKVCVELGTAYGVSALDLLAGLKETGGGDLYTIEVDPLRRKLAREAFESFFPEAKVTSLEGLFADRLPELLRKLDRPIDLVFEDGPHIPEVTLQVFQLLRDHVRPGGLMLFDDVYHRNGNIAAWTVIKRDPTVAASVEINGRLGICVKA